MKIKNVILLYKSGVNSFTTVQFLSKSVIVVQSARYVWFQLCDYLFIYFVTTLSALLFTSKNLSCAMSKNIVETFGLSSNISRYAPLKNPKRFAPSKRKSRINLLEKKPLITSETDSCSDEEITLHDVRHFKTRHQTINETEAFSSSLRRVRENDSSTVNGVSRNDIRSSDPFQHCEFLELKIEEGDTLQSISIKYRCPVSDLKRANNLINSQEFFALQYLKIPVKKHSILTESLPVVHNLKYNATTIMHENDNNVRTINIGIGSMGHERSPQEAADFFKRMDEDLVKIMLSTKTQKDTLEAAAAALTTPRIQPLVKDPYNGVDCGIQWNYLIIFMITIALVIPIGIALYMYMRSSPPESHHVYPSNSSAQTFNSVSKENIKIKR